jgi:hypothetical protein
MPTEAGRGEHHVYTIVPKNGEDRAKLTAGSHYVGVDAVSWFINKQNSWFSDRIPSGTLEIKMSGGLEDYPVALGGFRLPEGGRIAPVFQNPILTERNYRGGPISFKAMLAAVKKDAALAGMLKTAASASLGIVAGMVETATLSGPAGILGAASNDIIVSVRRMLTDPNLKAEPIFDFANIDFNLRPEAVIGPEIYVLFHRGAVLHEAGLSVKAGVDVQAAGLSARRQSATMMPYYDNAPLEDGAWLLLRVRRSDEYSGARGWYIDTGKLRGKIKSLVDDVKAGLVTKEDGLTQLKPTETGGQTIVDEFFRLRSLILNDGVLSEREAGAQVGLLYAAIVAAREAVKKGNPQLLTATINSATEALGRGEGLNSDIGAAFKEQVALVAGVRKSSIAKDTHPSRIVKLSGDELFSTMQYLPKTLQRCNLK